MEVGSQRLLGLLPAFCCFWLAISDVARPQEQGLPSFSVKPPMRVEFSNTTGTKIPCSSSNTNPPSKTEWLMGDGSTVLPINGLREVLPDGTLVMLPFKAEDFRQDVHATTYKCSIKNQFGTIISNDISLKAVVLQPFDVYVYDVFTTRGNTAVMKCHVPSFMTRYVTVNSWIRDNVVAITPGKITSDSKYIVVPGGELFVTSASSEDTQSSFQCQYTNKLTGETKKSVTSGKFFVTDPQGNVPPKVTFSTKIVSAKQGETVFLPCEVQGYPVPQVSWSKTGRNMKDDFQQNIIVGGRISLVSKSLIIEEVQKSDARIYVCTSSNVAGKETKEIHLRVNEQLRVQLEPSELTVDAGQSATLNCKITGEPINSIVWAKDGQPLSQPDVEIRSNTSIYIASVSSVHSGIYQCLVKNDVESTFAVSIIKLGDVLPIIISGFEEQVHQPGSSITLKCAFSGNPLPEVIWLLDNQHLVRDKRVTQSQSVVDDSKIISTLTINQASTEVGGVYMCKAENTAGKTSHERRINIYGKLGSRSRSVLHVVNKETVTFSCPFYGYPFSEARWEKEGQILPFDVRQLPFSNGSLTIRNLQRKTDGGLYTCYVGESEHIIQSEVQVVVMVPPKLAPFSFQDELVREGMRGRLQCVVLEGDLPITLTWLKDDQTIPSSLGVTIREIDEFSSILTIASISPRHNGNYTCLAKNPAAAVSFTAKLAVNVPPKILPFNFQDDQFFKGMRAQIICAVSQGDLPLTFSWLKDGKIIPPSLGVATRSYDGHANSLSIESVSSGHTGNYTCVVSNQAATVSHTAQLLVYVAPKIIPFSFQDSGIIAEGVLTRISCVIYQGDLPININWFKDTKPINSIPGVTVRSIDEYSSILTIENISRDHAGNYTCVATNAAAAVSQHTQLTVNVPPKIVPFTFQDEHLSEGMLVRVSCVVSRGDLPLTITWFKDDKPIPASLSVSIRDFDEYSSVISIDPVTSSHNGNYTCIARNHAARASHTAELKIQVPPKWLVEPQNITVKSGETAFLHCSATGLPLPTIEWLWAKGIKTHGRMPVASNAKTSLLSNGTVVIKEINKEQQGLYFCTASNAVGQHLSKAITLSVLAPPTFKQRIQVALGQKGGNLTLTCSSSGDLPISFVWILGSSIINPAKDQRYTTEVSDSKSDSSAASKLTINWLDRKDTTVYKCQAENKYGKDEMDFQVTVQEIPDPPVTHYTFTTNESIGLSWEVIHDGNSQIANYIVQYKKKSDNWQTRAMNLTVPGSINTVTIPELQPSTSYHIRVAAQNNVGIGAFSQVITIQTEEGVPSGAPQNVEVESTDQQTLRVTWKPPRKSHWNGAIRGYNIGFKVEGSQDSLTYHNLEVPEDYTEDLIYQLTNLKMFTQYDIVVEAYNTKGKGPASEPVVAMTSEDVPSSPPHGVRCSALSSRSIYVLWEAPSSETINGIMRGFKIIYKPVTEWYASAIQKKIIPTTKVTLQSLEVNTNYTIQVLAFTKVGDGVKSDPVFCKTHEDVPEAPQDIKVLPSSSDSVVVAWKSPKNTNGGITKYNVYYKTFTDGQEFDPASDGNDAVALMTEQVKQDANSHTSHSDNQFLEVKGLKKNKKYAFWVTASSIIGEGPGSKVMAQTVADNVVPAKSASFDGTIKTPWKRDVVLPCKAVGVPPPQRKWTMGGKSVEGSGRNVILSDGTLLINKVSSEDSGNYTCAVYNEFGKDDINYAVVVQVPPAAPLLEIVSKGRTAIELQWKPGPDGGENVRGYILYYRPDNGPWETKELQPDRHFHTLDNLACGSSYQMYLEAFNSIGTGAPCDVITVSTEGSDVPPPSKESLLREGSTFVTVHLEAFPSSGCPINNYQVEYKKLHDQEWILVSDSLRPTQRKLVIPGLTPATWYSLRLVAISNGKHNMIEYNFATHTPAGGTILPPEIIVEHSPETVYLFYLDPYIFIPAVALLIVVIIASVVICVCVKRKNGSMGSPSDSATTLNTWPRTTRRGTYGQSSQYPTLSHRDSKDPSPYATSRLPDCFAQQPTAFFDPSLNPQFWQATLTRRPGNQMGASAHDRGRQCSMHNESIQQAGNSSMPGMEETMFVFPDSDQLAKTPVRGKPRPDEDYDQPPVGI